MSVGFARLIPASASYAASPCTSARSSLPCSSSGTFSALPLVFTAVMVMAGSASLTVSTSAAPYTGKPPPGVAVPRESSRGSLPAFNWAPDGACPRAPLSGAGATSLATQPASNKAATSAAALFDFDIGVLHDAGPLREVFRDVGAEVL